MRLSDNMKGALLMAASMTVFAVNDAFIKLATRELPLGQAVVLRGVAATLLIGLLTLAFGAFRNRPSRRDWGLIALRTLADIGMTWTFLNALKAMPLANVHAILQALPLTVTLGAALLLNEPIGWRRMLAILVGFVGVLIILRPGPAGFPPATLYAIGAVAMITLRDLVSRRLSPEVSSLSVAFFTAAGITLFFAPSALTEDWAVLRPDLVLLLVGAAVAIFFGYLFSVAAMRVGEIGFVSPFRYTGLLAALALGWLIFGDWPDPLTFAGGALVVATGVFTILRERRQPPGPAGQGAGSGSDASSC